MGSRKTVGTLTKITVTVVQAFTVVLARVLGAQVRIWEESNPFNEIRHITTDARYIDGLVQDRSNSSSLAMELQHSCIKPSIYDWLYVYFVRSTVQFRYNTAIILWNTHDDVMKSLTPGAWNWNTSPLTGLLWGESTDHQWISPLKGPAMGSFDVSSEITLNKMLNKQYFALTATYSRH